jgi:hypothetical protein
MPMTTTGGGAIGNSGDDAPPYEAPLLTPIGSLHDLLAGGGSQSCDNGVEDPAGGRLPFNDPSCTGG